MIYYNPHYHFELTTNYHYMNEIYFDYSRIKAFKAKNHPSDAFCKKW